MTFKTGELTVDLMNDVHTKEISFFQCDQNSAKLILNITNQGQELDLSKATSVQITFKKPDGTTVFQQDLQPINAMKGKYQIVLKTQTLAAIGYVAGQVHITEEDRKLDSKLFGFIVEKSLASDDAVESTNEYTIIQKAIEAGEKLEGVDIDGIIKAGELAKGAVQKSGDTIENFLNMRINGTGVGYRFVDDQNDAVAGIDARLNNNEYEIFLYDNIGANMVWSYSPSNGFNLHGKTNIVTKSKDDRANIPVTADAELIGSNGVIADRRGNTVTLSASIRRKAKSTNEHVFTMPQEMQPTTKLTQVVHSTDGTPALMTINDTTGQVLLQTITSTILDKDYHIVVTYVVD
ncbi:BppU family phage baseplate upper protein [Bacillus cytotoxicus]